MAKAVPVYDECEAFDVARERDKPVTAFIATTGEIGRAFPSGKWEHIRDAERREGIALRIAIGNGARYVTV